MRGQFLQWLNVFVKYWASLHWQWIVYHKRSHTHVHTHLFTLNGWIYPHDTVLPKLNHWPPWDKRCQYFTQKWLMHLRCGRIFSLRQIYWLVSQWMNSDNLSAFSKVTSKSMVATVKSEWPVTITFIAPPFTSIWQLQDHCSIMLTQTHNQTWVIDIANILVSAAGSTKWYGVHLFVPAWAHSSKPAPLILHTAT